jgi:Phage tail tube protein, GTA-gp10
MSADGSISLVWGDGEQTFRFAIGQFRELQEKVNQRRIAIGALPTGPMTLLNQLRANDAWPDDVRDVLRLGLIGGGATPADAHRLMVNYFDSSPPLEHMKPAFVVLCAGLAGPPGETDGDLKKKIKKKTARRRSTSSASTAQAPQ